MHERVFLCEKYGGSTLIEYDLVRSCDSRIYEYLFPSYILMPPHSGTPLAARLLHISRSKSPIVSSPSATSSQPSFMDTDRDREAFRCSEADMIKLRELLKQLEGTHNFYNYTVGREFRDRAAQRYMIKLEASNSF